MVATSEFWLGKRVLVTGGAGFLGRRVVAGLQSLGAGEVTVPRSSDWDLRDPEAVRRLLGSCRPQVVLHLAAKVGGIGANRLYPAEYFYDNLMMGVNLVHLSYQAGVEKFVGAGSVCAYPADCPVPFQESELWNGYPEVTNAPYGLAKRALITACQVYRRQYGFDAVSLLLVNLYGPEDNADPVSSHVIPALIRKAVEAKRSGADSVTGWGSGRATREFLYVDDAAEAVLLAAERYSGEEPVNVGSGQEISISDLFTAVARAVGFEGRIDWDLNFPDGQTRRCLDVSLAGSAFGFQARTDFQTGLARTVEWFETAGL
jgi:GDP-L-fucose synthase